MAFYVNRHLVSDVVTAERMAELHVEDLKIQHKFNCKSISCWFDEERKTAFCLVEAPDVTSLKRMHEYNHKDIPNKIIKLDETVIDTFIRSIEQSLHQKKPEINSFYHPAQGVLLLGEIKPFSLKKYKSEPVRDLILSIHQMIHSNITEFNGVSDLQQSNRFIATFKSVTCAIDCARTIKTKFILITDKFEDCGLQINIALSTLASQDKNENSQRDTFKKAGRLFFIDKDLINITSEVRECYVKDNFGILLHSKEINAFSPGDEEFFEQLMNFIENQYPDPALNSDDFSRKMGYSKSQLYRKMISVTGKTPNNFIKKYRLDKALNLLSGKKGNINQVAFDTGFNSPAYFSKCFEEAYGILPSSYLKEKF